MKKREKGGNEKIKGGEMQKKKERGKLESVGNVYWMHAANWTRVKNTRGQLAASIYYTWRLVFYMQSATLS
jgi:hypothetical protein